MSLAWSRSSVLTSDSIFASARKFSERMCRTTSRARASSLIPTSFLPTSRFTTASAILPAISSRLAMSPIETTRSRQKVSSELAEILAESGLLPGQEHPEARAFARQALDLDAAAVGMREPPHEAQAEAQPGCRRRLRIGNANVGVEDAREGLSGDADAVVLHGELDHLRLVGGLACLDAHAPAARRVLDGVRQEVLEHPVHSVAVGAEGRKLPSLPFELMPRMLGGEDLDVGLDHGAQVDGHALQRGAATGLDA